jgi:hypothetical protein
MAMPTPKKEQTYANHVRLDPPFHYFVVPVFGVTFVSMIVRAVRHPDWWALWLIVVALAAFVAVFLIRTYALKVQDRVIRLEERLRLYALAPESFRDLVPQLTARQLIGLRFASDGELPSLAQKVLTENLSSREIKRAIQLWRPDYERV